MSTGDLFGGLVKALGVGGAGAAAVLSPTAAIALGVVLGIALMVSLVGFVLLVGPAVWSRDPARRAAALEVLKVLRRGEGSS